MTNPRISDSPISGTDAWSAVQGWFDAGPTWIPPATERTARVLERLILEHHVTGNLVPDAMLAALAIEHGLAVVSADTDFARFPEVSWTNPLL